MKALLAYGVLRAPNAVSVVVCRISRRDEGHWSGSENCVAEFRVPSSAARSAGGTRPPGRVSRMECLRPAKEACPEVTHHRRSAHPGGRTLHRLSNTQNDGHRFCCNDLDPPRQDTERDARWPHSRDVLCHGSSLIFRHSLWNFSKFALPFRGPMNFIPPDDAASVALAPTQTFQEPTRTTP